MGENKKDDSAKAAKKHKQGIKILDKITSYLERIKVRISGIYRKFIRAISFVKTLLLKAIIFQLLILISLLIIPNALHIMHTQWNYLSWMKIKFPSRPDLMVTIFTAQVTICTLGITTLSFITNISRRQIYGVTISNFVLRVKPRLLNYETSMISTIVCVIYSLFFIVYGNIYSLIASLMFTVIILIFWFAKLSNVFINVDIIEEEIKKYVSDNFSNYGVISNNFFNELYLSIRTTDMQTVFYDLELLKDIIKNLTKNQNNLDVNINNSISKVIDEMTDKRLYAELLDWLIDIYEILEKGNKNAASKIYLQIDFSIYRMFRSFLINNGFEIYKKSKELIEKMFFVENNHNMQIVINIVYYYNSSIISCDNLSVNQKDLLLDDIFSFFNTFLIEEYKILQERCLSYFMKVLIDKEEFSKLKKYHDKIVKRGEHRKSLIEVYVYLYYLVNEDVSLKINVKLIKDFLKSNVCITVIEKYPFINYDLSEIWDIFDDVMSDIKDWERFNEFEAKWVMMEYITKDFFILSMLVVPNYISIEHKLLEYFDYYELGSYFEGWIDSNGILGDKFTIHCNEFKELFIRNAEANIDKLKDSLYSILKQKVINENNKIVPIGLHEKKNEILEKLNSKFEKINIGKNIEEISYKKIPLTDICSLKGLDFSEYINEQFIFNIQSQVFINIIHNLQKNLLFTNSKIIEDGKISKVFSMIDKIKENACIDTIFKNKNIDITLLENQHDIAKYNRVVGDYRIFNEYNMYPYICFLLDSEKVIIKTGDFYVNFSELSEEEIINNYTEYVSETDKYLIRVYNNVACEFTKDEAINYIKSQRIMVSFDFDLYIKVLEDTKIGCAMKIVT